MKHMKEEELIAYREGVAEQRAAISEHLAACEECRVELERIEAVLAALDTLPVPDPGADYGRQVWKEIAPRLEEKRGRWWRVWLEPRRLAAAGASKSAAMASQAVLVFRIEFPMVILCSSLFSWIRLEPARAWWPLAVVAVPC